ncbi:helix-turn-helix domain-containing protein [Lysinibacillus sp. JNUCC 51]|uniref:helix-turn-helix domain-containing protein n=1 Tax=Lysinibacillus sp. JNUCC-51 TaxID=2792479 RepID=UPI0019356F20|nr:helix-turn-helix transcriptional regulator [Lysinibacillus sp. JNUCC-51]
MIRNRLAALMAERGLKITRVAKDTGISRNTITSISQNDSEMMRMETINTLCKYLGVTPCEFYEYEPIDFEFSVFLNSFNYYLDRDFVYSYINVNNIDIEVILDVDKLPQKQSFDLKCSLFTSKKMALDEPDSPIQVNIEFEDYTEKNTFINEIYNKINNSFRQDIYKNLKNVLVNELKERILQEIGNTAFSINEKQELEKSIKNSFRLEILSDVFAPF